MKDRSSRYGIRRPAFLEITLFLALALAIDWLFFDGTRFHSMSLHPFWILVLLVTVQYGTNAGLFAAVASTIALLAGNVPLQPAFQDRFQWLFEVMRLPLLWCLTAVTLGELRMRQIREREYLRDQVAEALRRDKILTDGYKRLNAVKEALETRVAGQLRTAVSLYEAAKAIEKLDPAEVLLGVSSLIRSVMSPEKFSLYLLRNGALELAFSEGWTSEDRFPRLYTPADRLFHETIGRQRVVSVANPEDERILAGVGLIAAPLIAPDTGHLAGMLQIEKLGFLDLNFSNAQTFKVLCEWIGSAYDNALRYQAARSEAVMNPQTELFAYGFLARQLSLFTLLARRIGFDLTMIVVRLENPAELTDEQQARVPIAFGQVVSKVLRKSDMAFDYQRTGAEFAVVLPATKANGAYMVVDKLQAGIDLELAVEAPEARFAFSVHAIHDTDRVEDPSLELEYA